ncbi:MAG: DUF1553 domain-containing protein, partial [Armatimonadetes bacterium]|nr:DUF1553 domain-containing protein [Armatimonadota bacterium]
FRADLPIGTPEEQARYETALRGHQTELAALEARMAALAPEERAAFRQEKLALLPEDVQRAFATPAAERNAEQAQLVQRHGPALEPRPEVLLERLPEPRRPAFRSLMHDREALLKRQPAPAPRAVGLWEEGAAPPPTRILVRGELANPGAEVTPRFPAVLTAAAPNVAAPLVGRSSGRRSALAQWLTRPDHPLTARVFVNRVWQGVFGRGLVASASDFGVRGETPTHPALLDWLTSEFTAQGWRPRALLRLLVRSAVFQQAAVSSTETRRRDPENRWWSRMSRRRLEAEAIRDSLLAISGRLNRKAGGPGVFPPLPEEDRPRGTVWPVSPDLAEHRRRSLYLFVRRNLSFPGLEPFDSPDSNLSCARRETTITAPQALALWNGEEAVAAARGLASRVLAGASEPTARIALAYRLALGRPPIGEEQALAEGFLRRQTALLADRAPGALLLPDPLGKEPPTAGTAAWTDYCLALLNSNEFLYVD